MVVGARLAVKRRDALVVGSAGRVERPSNGPLDDESSNDASPFSRASAITDPYYHTLCTSSYAADDGGIDVPRLPLR